MKNIKNKNIKWWIGITSCLMLFSFIGVFAYMKMSFVLTGVQINANIERSNNTPVTVISGTAKNATYLSLNGREIFINKDGSFSESIALIPGLSVVTITAQDKFGMNKEKKFNLVYKESAPSVALIDKIINTN
jgi:magnesium-transporting ATPase (P-type)